MPEEHILVCKLASSKSYISGCIKDRCCMCGNDVWIAPSSLLLIHDIPDMKIKCNPCALTHIRTEGGKLQDLTPAQIEELKECLDKEG